MASKNRKPEMTGPNGKISLLGPQPFNRDRGALAFNGNAKIHRDGQELAGKGALVFEGEVLELPCLY